VPLLPLVESVVVQLAHLLDGKPVRVEVNIVEDAHFCVARPALAVVLSNIVSNAFQHTREGWVRISFDGERLSVSDEGPGVEESIRARLFEAGVKGCDSSGHGLGLSIARRLAERVGLELALAPGAQGGTVATLAPRK
jgi:signal transduction histidine kinase